MDYTTEKPKRQRKQKDEVYINKDKLEELLVLTQAKVRKLKKESKPPSEKKERTQAQKDNWTKIMDANKAKKESQQLLLQKEQEKLVKIKVKPSAKRKPNKTPPPIQRARPVQNQINVW